MTSLDGPNTPRTVEIEQAFSGHLAQGAVDIVQDIESGDIEVRSDTWTLAMQPVPPRVAFLAIDDEPTEDAGIDAALDSTLLAEDLSAMQWLDRSFNGSLRSALRESGDPLSIALAERLG